VPWNNEGGTEREADIEFEVAAPPMDCTSTLYLARSNNCSIDVSVGDPFPNLSCACKSTIMGSMMELLVKNVVAARTLGVCVVQEECPPYVKG